VLVADLVRARGFKVITTQEAGNIGATDRQQLAAAVSLQSTFVTHNRIDFEFLAEEFYVSGHKHYGIVIAVPRSPYEIVRRLLAINNVAADEMKDQLRYI